MSAFRDQADMISCPHMSAYDPKRTWDDALTFPFRTFHWIPYLWARARVSVPAELETLVMRSERFDFPSAKGERLAAVLDLPLGKPVAFALFAHCFTCSKEIPAARRIAKRLVMDGIGVLRFDFTGIGGSGGEFANTHFSSNVDDLVAAADHLRKTYGAPAILIGHSLGGAAVLAAARRIPDARAVVT